MIKNTLKKIICVLLTLNFLGIDLAVAESCPQYPPYSLSRLQESDRCPPVPAEQSEQVLTNFTCDIYRDFQTYLQPDTLRLFGGALVVAGVLANTGLDQSFAANWQANLKGPAWDSFFLTAKKAGDYSIYVMALSLGSIGVGYLQQNTQCGSVFYNWGYRNIRTFILGGVQQALFTVLLGSGRPCRGDPSKWQPFRYNRGVSGHAFYGAVPFITAAMMTEPPLLKYTLYVLSTLPGLSRINTNSHYLSQVFLGWTIALLSARAVYDADLDRQGCFQIGLYPRGEGAMLTAHLKF